MFFIKYLKIILVFLFADIAIKRFRARLRDQLRLKNQCYHLGFLLSYLEIFLFILIVDK